MTYIKDVKVIPGCISCRTCENVCPSVFKVDPKSRVITDSYEGKESEILQAEAMCPVNVIKVTANGAKISFQDAYLREKNWLTPDILELRFEAKNFHPTPGQYISLRMRDGYGDFSRSYSLAEYEKNFFTLTVKILKKGRGSRALQKMKIGKKCNYLGPLGTFTLKNTQKPKVCIATGTGLAPMISILQNAAPDVKKILIYGVRFEHDLYYLSKLALVENLEIIIKVSRPHKEHTKNQGRVTDELDKIPKNSEVYVSGNPDMVQDVSRRVKKIQDTNNISLYKESFTLSSHYKGKFDHHITQGNIPFLWHISWLIIILSLGVIVPAWFYMQSQGSLYTSVGPIENFMGFLYDLSWFSVVFVMAIRPLADIFPNIGILRTLRYFRKSLGILSASIIVVNWLGMWYFSPDKISQYLVLGRWELWYPIIARLSELTAFILLLTSNEFSQKFLGAWWKRIQRTSYIYFVTGGIMAAQLSPYKVYPLMILVGAVYAIATWKNWKK